MTKKIANQKGFTLIEVLAATAILSLVGLIMISGFTIATRVLEKNIFYRVGTDNAINSLEKGVGKIVRGTADIKIIVDGTEANVCRNIYFKKELLEDNGNKVGLINVNAPLYIGEEPESWLFDYCLEYDGMTAIELHDYGYAEQYKEINNDKMSDMIQEIHYGEKWDEFDKRLLEELGLKNIPDKPLYIFPKFETGPSTFYIEDMIIFAGELLDTGRNTGLAYLVYNHENNMWYWQPHPSSGGMSSRGIQAMRNFDNFKETYIDTGIFVPLY